MMQGTLLVVVYFRLFDSSNVHKLLRRKVFVRLLATKEYEIQYY